MQVLFDMNGTLFDPAALAEPLGGSARDHALIEAALAGAVSMAMAETLTGGYQPFKQLLERATARELAAADRDIEAAAAVAEASARMHPFPDAAEAIEALRSAGLGVGVLTNSSTAGAEKLAAAADLELDPVIGSDSVKAFKPHPSVYEHAVRLLGLPADEVVLVAAHWWDVLGAKRAGLQAGYVDRDGPPLPDLEPQPDYHAGSLAAIAAEIVAERS